MHQISLGQSSCAVTFWELHHHYSLHMFEIKLLVCCIPNQCLDIYMCKFQFHVSSFA